VNDPGRELARTNTFGPGVSDRQTAREQTESQAKAGVSSGVVSEARPMTTHEDHKAASEGTETEPKRRGVMQSLTALCVRYVERL